jgi:hypothetical protein
MSMKLSTLTAEAVDAYDYVHTYVDKGDHSRVFEDLASRNATGVVVKFGDAVVAHWLDFESYFGLGDPEREQSMLDEVVAGYLAKLFPSAGS